MRYAASLVLLCAFAAALAACAADKVPKVESNIMPAKYKDEVIGTLRPLFDKNGTATVSNAMISDPVLQPVGTEQHYAVCVRYTAHSVDNSLTGNAERIGYFYGGHLNQLVPADNGACAKAAYHPFPELDQVCLGTGCK